jgi:hypothetical protein
MTTNKNYIYLWCSYIMPGTTQYQQLVCYVPAVEPLLYLVHVAFYNK